MEAPTLRALALGVRRSSVFAEITRFRVQSVIRPRLPAKLTPRRRIAQARAHPSGYSCMITTLTSEMSGVPNPANSALGESEHDGSEHHRIEHGFDLLDGVSPKT